MELNELRLGDLVRLKNGETIGVDSKVTSYHDRDGEHEGPFVMRQGDHEYIPLADVVEVVAANPRLCVYCGEGVTSMKADFCRGCFYTGRVYEERHDALLRKITETDGVQSAHFWHTGGGCFLLAVTLDDGRLLTPSEGYRNEDGSVFPEPTIPENDGERWAMVASRDEAAWEDPDAWEAADPNGGNDDAAVQISQRLLTEDELVEAVAYLAARRGELILA